MPARAHRRAPDHLAGAVPNPPCRGLALYGPPTKAPRSLAPRGRWPPSTPPFPQAVRRTGESVKSPYPPPRRGGLFTDPPGGGGCSEAPPPPPSKAEGAPPCVHPGPRASRAGFASPPLHLPSTPPAGAANSPAAPTGAPRPPSQGREAPPAAPRPGLGGGGPPVAHGYVGTGVPGGSYREGHPARAPTVRSPAMPASLTQRNAATLADPHSLSPGPLGPGRFYTDSPTPFGV
ncbi:hypothetical protein N7530_012886 [Penicillium desertorum]|uniref:Uncharacterized protein n=1 Tax=Penicillium desertorum TaxID=1303715 RepID=A0A9X0BFJ1_9EURO|nr:hypothetical protein N7530_012886 [Penicillium desertorum]